jgi:RHS repeat-associated protein
MVENHNGSNQFVYSPVGQQPLAWMQGQVPLYVYVPLPAGAFAMYNSSGLVQYNHADWLGSARLFSTPGHTPIPALAYAPFGEGYAGGAGWWIQFTGAGNAWTVADSENQSGSLEDFLFRRYSPVQGRWISPDPAGMSAADPSNPQSWNRYAYVNNNPLSFTDTAGLNCGDPASNSQDGDTISVTVYAPCDDPLQNFYDYLSSVQNAIVNRTAQVTNQVSDVLQTATNWVTAPRDPGCLAASAAGGAAAGAIGGGIAGGFGGTLVAPGVGTLGGGVAGASEGASLGAQLGFAAGSIVGSIKCASGGGGGGSSKNSGKTVRQILQGKKGSIKNAPLPPGSPSWDSILDNTWEEIEAGAKANSPGYREIRKLLTDGRFDR